MTLDSIVRNYFKKHKSLETNEKSIIYENVYDLVRYKTYLDVISPKPLSWDGRFETFYSKKFLY